MHETSEVKIGIQVLRDGSLAAGCGGSMDIREEICGFEELGTLQRCLFCKSKEIDENPRRYYKVGWLDRKGCGLPEQASMN